MRLLIHTDLRPVQVVDHVAEAVQEDVAEDVEVFYPTYDRRALDPSTCTALIKYELNCFDDAIR